MKCFYATLSPVRASNFIIEIVAPELATRRTVERSEQRPQDWAPYSIRVLLQGCGDDSSTGATALGSLRAESVSSRPNRSLSVREVSHGNRSDVLTRHSNNRSNDRCLVHDWPLFSRASADDEIDSLSLTRT
jgi:hypothetical protein